MQRTKLIGSLLGLTLMFAVGSAAHAGGMKDYGQGGSDHSNGGYSQQSSQNQKGLYDQNKQYDSQRQQSQDNYSSTSNSHDQPSYQLKQSQNNYKVKDDSSQSSYSPPKQNDYTPAQVTKSDYRQDNDQKHDSNNYSQSSHSQSYGDQKNRFDGQKNHDQNFDRDDHKSFDKDQHNFNDHRVVEKKVVVVKPVRVTVFNVCDMRNFWNGSSWNQSMMSRFSGCFCPQGFGQGWNQGFGMSQSDWNWMMQRFCGVRSSNFSQDCTHFGGFSNSQATRPTAFIGDRGFTAPTRFGGGNVTVNGVNSITGPYSINTNRINVGEGFGTADLSAANEITGPFSRNTNLINVFGGVRDLAVSALNHLTGPFSVNRNEIGVSGHRSSSWNGGKFNGFNSAGTRFASFRNVDNVSNNISVSANTGFNNANFNTVGGSIQTGDITTTIGVQNE